MGDKIPVFPTTQARMVGGELLRSSGTLMALIILDQLSISLPFKYAAKIVMDSLGHSQGGRYCNCLHFTEEEAG